MAFVTLQKEGRRWHCGRGGRAVDSYVNNLTIARGYGRGKEPQASETYMMDADFRQESISLDSSKVLDKIVVD